MNFSKPWRSEQARYHLVCAWLLLWGHHLHWGNHCFLSQLRSPADGTETLKRPRTSWIKNGAVSCTTTNIFKTFLEVQQIPLEKGHTQISISGNSSKKNKKLFLRKRQSIETILNNEKLEKIISPEQVRNLRRERGDSR